jgi:transcriptional regulator with XRE-family HTH domain
LPKAAAVMPPAQIDPALAAAIRGQRHARGLTQERVAHTAGITAGTYNAIERGRTNPTWSTVKRIAGALALKPSELAASAERHESDAATRGVQDEPQPIPEGELVSPYQRERLLQAGANLTDAEDFYYFAAERAAHEEPIASAGAPEPRHLEMLRLRLIEGLTLREVGEQTGVAATTVMQLLSHYFGVCGVPPAAKARRRRR